MSEQVIAPCFPIYEKKETFYNSFVNLVMYDSQAKDLMMKANPKEVGMIQFEVQRNRKGLSFMQPKFVLKLEKSESQSFPIAFSKRMLFNKSSSFIITLDRNSFKRKSEACLGKLRGNREADEYHLYNNGENPKKRNKFPPW